MLLIHFNPGQKSFPICHAGQGEKRLAGQRFQATGLTEKDLSHLHLRNATHSTFHGRYIFLNFFFIIPYEVGLKFLELLIQLQNIFFPVICQSEDFPRPLTEKNRF